MRAMGDEQRDVTEQAAVHGQIHPFGAAKARDGYLCGADMAAGGATADLCKVRSGTSYGQYLCGHR